ncbi:MAG: acyl-CoA carboxylase epsilon subunit [Streptosporangiaceae bacterium]
MRRHPVLTIVRGDPDDAEVAALVAVLAARAHCTESAADGRVSGAGLSDWSDRSRLLREPLAPGQGAWRRSALPR